jgi:hypothetical protein
MYGEFKWAEKYKTWDRLRNIHQQNSLPWLVMGDLNEILFNYEKEGGRLRPDRFRKDFHDALDDCQLNDIGYIGDLFTWHRGQMRERLDRGLANSEWIHMHERRLLSILNTVILIIGHCFWIMTTIHQPLDQRSLLSDALKLSASRRRGLGRWFRTVGHLPRRGRSTCMED